MLASTELTDDGNKTTGSARRPTVKPMRRIVELRKRNEMSFDCLARQPALAHRNGSDHWVEYTATLFWERGWERTFRRKHRQDESAQSTCVAILPIIRDMTGCCFFHALTN